jgi:hypothetical protein
LELERSVILVKAWPQPSAKYGETVCCAGVTPDGEWRRLFPIRFRHLTGDRQFSRWDTVEYVPRLPVSDRRKESRTIEENSLKRVGQLKPASRGDFFASLIRPSIAAAAERGESLALVRPDSFEFVWKRKADAEIEADREKRGRTLSQGSLFDKELAAIEPCPFDIRMRFTDETGRHDMACGDWETAATFFKWRREYGEDSALLRLKDRYEGEYADAGVAFAFGTMAKHPTTWILLGIIRLDESHQMRLI